MEISRNIYNSPVGALALECSQTALVALRFADGAISDEAVPANKLLHQVLAQLDAYFAGTAQVFQMPIAQTGTAFQTKVWDLLQEIPFGRTCSYMELAKRYGDVKAIRAVAAANGKNNIAIVVPCHRVIGTNRTLTGYAGGLWRKQWLLAHEAKYFGGVQALF